MCRTTWLESPCTSPFLLRGRVSCPHPLPAHPPAHALPAHPLPADARGNEKGRPTFPSNRPESQPVGDSENWKKPGQGN